jgi:hypothetical protein
MCGWGAAASFVPPKTGSAVRLFNLAADVKFAGLDDGTGKQLVDQIQYTLGSAWVPVPGTQQTFSKKRRRSPGGVRHKVG